MSGADAPELQRIFGGPDASLAGLLLLAGPDARRDGWAARTAVALAEAWSRSAAPAVLADACFESPELHGVIAEPNGEGIADVFLFGASLRRVRRVVAGRPFEFIPAGLYVPDPASVLEHGAWSRLLEDTLAAGRRLVVYAPAAAAGISALAARMPSTVLLLASPRDQDIARGLNLADVRAVFTPPQRAQDTVVANVDDAPRVRRSDAEFERIRLPRDDARDSLIADLRLRQRAAVLGRSPQDEQPAIAAGGQRPPPPPLMERTPPPTPEALLAEPAFTSTERPEPPRQRRHPLFWTVLIVALLSVLAGLWHFVLRGYMAGPAGAAATAGAAGTADSVVAPPPPGAPRELPFSVVVGAHLQLSDAEDVTAVLREVLPDVPFFIAPRHVEDAVYYSVMAGPYADSVRADSVKQQLVGAGHKTVSLESDIPSTPLAFLLGEFDSRGAAEARRDEVRILEIPSYIITAMTPEGRRFRVYAGGYRSSAEADFMRNMLRNVGVPDSLVSRVGSTTP